MPLYLPASPHISPHLPARAEQAAKLDELRRRSVAEGDTLRGKVASLDAALLEAKQAARAAKQQATQLSTELANETQLVERARAEAAAQVGEAEGAAASLRQQLHLAQSAQRGAADRQEGALAAARAEAEAREHTLREEAAAARRAAADAVAAAAIGADQAG